MAVPVLPPRGPRPTDRLPGVQRLIVFGWVQLALTICGVAYAVALIQLLVDGGNEMACFDGDQLACTADPVSVMDLWRSLTAGAILIGIAAVAVFVAYQHRRGRARRSTSIGVLGMSAALDGLAAIVLLWL